jgi:hypothetical protein
MPTLLPVPEPDYYALLGLLPSATQEEIATCLRERLREVHPDLSPSPENRAAFDLLLKARATLTDPEKRQQYHLNQADTPLHNRYCLHQSRLAIVQQHVQYWQGEVHCLDGSCVTDWDSFSAQAYQDWPNTYGYIGPANPNTFSDILWESVGKGFTLLVWTEAQSILPNGLNDLLLILDICKEITTSVNSSLQRDRRLHLLLVGTSANFPKTLR